MARILVVDDDPSIREVLEAVLAMEDHEVVCARNGREGMEWLGIERFDLLLLDIMMPDLSGYEVLEQLRADPANASTPVVIMSGRADQDGLIRGARFGALDHIMKPFNPDDLLGLVTRVVGTSQDASRLVSEMRTRSADVYSAMLSLVESARVEQSQSATG